MIRLTTAPILSEAAFAWATTACELLLLFRVHPFRPPAEQVQCGDVDIDPGEGVPYLVGDPGGQLAEGGELLPCHHDLLEVFHARDVDHVDENSGLSLEVDRNGPALHAAKRLLPRLDVGHGEPELHPLPERLPLPHRTAKPLELRDVLRVGRSQPSKIEPLRDRTHKTLQFRIPEGDAALLDDHGADGLVLDQGPEPGLALPKPMARHPALLLHPDTLGELPLEPDVHIPELFRPLGHPGIQLIPRDADLLFVPFHLPEDEIVGAVEADHDDRLVDQVVREDIQVMAEEAAIHVLFRAEIVHQHGGDREDNGDDQFLKHLPVEMLADPPDGADREKLYPHDDEIPKILGGRKSHPGDEEDGESASQCDCDKHGGEDRKSEENEPRVEPARNEDRGENQRDALDESGGEPERVRLGGLFRDESRHRT